MPLCIPSGGELMAAAQVAFRLAVGEELSLLIGSQMSREQAVEVLLKRILSFQEKKFTEQEVLKVMTQFHMNKTDATRALVVKQELGHLKRQGYDPLSAIKELTRKMRQRQPSSANNTASSTKETREETKEETREETESMKPPPSADEKKENCTDNNDSLTSKKNTVDLCREIDAFSISQKKRKLEKNLDEVIAPAAKKKKLGKKNSTEDKFYYKKKRSHEESGGSSSTNNGNNTSPKKKKIRV